jgi:uncharacterized Fe-S center protein
MFYKVPVKSLLPIANSIDTVAIGKASIDGVSQRFNDLHR